MITVDEDCVFRSECQMLCIEFQLSTVTQLILPIAAYHIRPQESTRHLHSSTPPLLHRPTTRTHALSDALLLLSGTL